VSSHYDGYKNALIKSTELVLSKRIRIKPEVLSELFDCLLLELSQALDKIVAQAETSFLAEQKGNFFKFEEKKEEEQHNLSTAENVYSCMPKMLGQRSLAAESKTSMLEMLCQVSEDKFARSNWMVRKAILECFKGILKHEVQEPQALQFGKYLIC
jgi:hypothetical protein